MQAGRSSLGWPALPLASQPGRFAVSSAPRLQSPQNHQRPPLSLRGASNSPKRCPLPRSPAGRCRARVRCAICCARPHIRWSRLGVRGKAFRESAVNGVGPAVLLADHLVSDVCHRVHLSCRIIPYATKKTTGWRSPLVLTPPELAGQGQSFTNQARR